MENTVEKPVEITKKKSTSYRFLRFYKKYGIIIFFLLEVTIFSLLSKPFFTVSNGLNLIRSVSMLGTAAVGVAFVFLGGAVDLSIAGLIPLVSMITGVALVWWGFPVWSVLIIALLVGVIVGAINGIIATFLKINPFVVSLGMMSVLQGVALLFTKGISITGLPRNFAFLGQGYIGFLPVPIVVLAVAVIVAQLVLSKTYFGRFIYALGGNPEAARLAGIGIDKVRIATYAISGFFGAIAALIMTSRTMTASPSAGSAYAFDTMTAIILGGISFTGGEGNLWNAFIGVLIIGTLGNGLTILNVGSYWQTIIKGTLLILTLYLDRVQKTVKVEE